MPTGSLVAASHCLVVISLKLPTLLFQPGPAFLIRTTIALILQCLALLALSLTAGSGAVDKKSYTQAELTEYEKRKGAREVPPDVRQIGLIASVYTILLPYLFPQTGKEFEPILTTLLRVSCFFYACKILDLCVVRAASPPQLTKGGSKPVDLDTRKKRLEYIFLLYTEVRYASFSNLAVNETRRSSLPSSSKLWTFVPVIAIPTATYLLPIAELKVLCGLLAISHALETVHTILHPRCPNALFHTPFSASSMTAFWTVHWHQGAQPWLYNLAYRPTSDFLTMNCGISKEFARAAAVLATFSLSGLWHAWCAAALSTHPWSVGAGLWFVLLLQGVGCLVERKLFGKPGGGVLQRLLCWTLALETAAVWLRYAERTVNVPRLGSSIL